MNTFNAIKEELSNIIYTGPPVRTRRKMDFAEYTWHVQEFGNPKNRTSWLKRYSYFKEIKNLFYPEQYHTIIKDDYKGGEDWTSTFEGNKETILLLDDEKNFFQPVEPKKSTRQKMLEHIEHEVKRLKYQSEEDEL